MARKSLMKIPDTISRVSANSEMSDFLAPYYATADREFDSRYDIIMSYDMKFNTDDKRANQNNVLDTAMFNAQKFRDYCNLDVGRPASIADIIYYEAAVCLLIQNQFAQVNQAVTKRPSKEPLTKEELKIFYRHGFVDTLLKNEYAISNSRSIGMASELNEDILSTAVDKLNVMNTSRLESELMTLANICRHEGRIYLLKQQPFST